MNLATAYYSEQVSSWPTTGKHILAHYDNESVIVYQAYCPSIAEFAITNGSFGGEFSYTRMSWIKPNFLWMMYRSQWGQAQGQEVTLAIRLRRQFFESLLNQAVPSSFDGRLFATHEEWQSAVKSSCVRFQWDPDHLPTGEKCERRALQAGLRGAVLEAYGKREIVEIIDMSTFVAEQRAHVGPGQNHQTLTTPLERVYVPVEQRIIHRLGLDGL
jgi:hypothetical protein